MSPQSQKQPIQQKVIPRRQPVRTDIIDQRGGEALPDGPQGEILAMQDATGNRATGQALEHTSNNPSLSGLSVPPDVYDVLQSPGQPLDTDTRAFLESRFGYDLSHVRVHTDTRASEAAQAIGANAFTAGNEMVFESEQYSPQTATGRHLLAHELTHVIQQAESAGQHTSIVDDSKGGFEDDANRVSALVDTGHIVHVSTRGAPPAIQRQKGIKQLPSPGKSAVGYSSAVEEAKNLWWALKPERNRKKITVEAVERFIQFSDDQILQVGEVWRKQFKVDLPLLVESRLGSTYAKKVQIKLNNARKHLLNVINPEKHKKWAAEEERKHRQDVQRVVTQELDRPTTTLGHFLKGRYGSLSKEEQQGVQGLLYFIHQQRRQNRGWLQAGERYKGVYGDRWFLGKDPGKTIWMDDKLKVYALTDRDELLEAFRLGIVSAAPWVPIAKGVMIFTVIVIGAALTPGISLAVGRAMLAAVRTVPTILRVAGKAIRTELSYMAGAARDAWTLVLSNLLEANDFGILVGQATFEIIAEGGLGALTVGQAILLLFRQRVSAGAPQRITVLNGRVTSKQGKQRTIRVISQKSVSNMPHESSKFSTGAKKPAIGKTPTSKTEKPEVPKAEPNKPSQVGSEEVSPKGSTGEKSSSTKPEMSGTQAPGQRSMTRKQWYEQERNRRTWEGVPEGSIPAVDRMGKPGVKLPKHVQKNPGAYYYNPKTHTYNRKVKKNPSVTISTRSISSEAGRLQEKVVSSLFGWPKNNKKITTSYGKRIPDYFLKKDPKTGKWITASKDEKAEFVADSKYYHSQEINLEGELGMQLKGFIEIAANKTVLKVLKLVTNKDARIASEVFAWAKAAGVTIEHIIQNLSL